MDPTVSEMVMSALTVDERGRLQKLLDVCAVNITNNLYNDNDYKEDVNFENNNNNNNDNINSNGVDSSDSMPEYSIMYSSSIRNVTQYRAILKVRIREKFK